MCPIHKPSCIEKHFEVPQTSRHCLYLSGTQWYVTSGTQSEDVAVETQNHWKLGN